MVSRFRFIEAEKANYAVALLCRVLGISRAGFYAWTKRSASLRTQADIALTERIRQVHSQSRGTYGAPRVHAALVAEGQPSGCKRIARLMRLAGLQGCVRRRKHPQTTVVNPAAVPAPNLVQRQFTPVAPNYLWIGDITYLRTDEGWLYLAVLLDAYSRRVVGWAMAEHMRVDLVLDALKMAYGRRVRGTGPLVHHTDRGSQYTAGAYQQALTAQSITCSMSRTGNCYDNAAAESFFATLKRELIERRVWATRLEVRTAVFEWIEVFYNRQRRHSTLGYLSPVEFERRRPTERVS
jgi:putative transposase